MPAAPRLLQAFISFLVAADLAGATVRRYLQAIKEVQKQVERRISRNPNDKDAVRDLNNIKEEYSKISADSTLPKTVRDDFDIQKIKRLNSINTEEGKNPGKRFDQQDNGFDRDI